MSHFKYLIACSALLLATTSSAFAQQVDTYRTMPDLTVALQRMGPYTFFTKTASSNAARTIVIDEKQRFQTMDGFGASLTDSSAWLLQEQLPATIREQVMKKLFDPGNGIGISFLRQPLGASDLSRDHYSYDDMPRGEKDPGVRHFSIKHDEAYILPITREAIKLNPRISVMVTPWSPPGWMKTKDSMLGGALREDALADYATYLVKSVESYGKAGVPVKYLSVQNEPLNETTDYPGTLMLADQQKRLIGNYLGPALRRAGLKTQILAYDHNWDHPEYPEEVLADAKAAEFVAGSALHCYGGDVSAQDVIHNRFPGKGIWMTECSGGSWQNGNLLATTAQLIIESSRNWARSVVLWGIALDTHHGPHAGGCGTCRGLVTVNRDITPPTVTYTADYYAMGSASKFVHPGAVRIASTSFGRQDLETVAFQNTDGSIALLVLNNAAKETEFKLQWHGKLLDTSLSAGSLATYVWK